MILLTDEQCREGIQRICEIARDIARMSGIVLNSISVDDSHHLTCTNFHILHISARGKTVAVNIHHEEVAEITSMTEDKIRSAIDRLRIMLEG